MAEEGVSIRAVRRDYAAAAGLALDQVPEPRRIAEIATGEAPGDRRAAAEAFRRLGQVAGDAIANALTLIDGLVVLGGGLSGAAGLFRAALLEELNGTLELASGPVDRLPFRVLDLDDPAGLAALIDDHSGALAVPGTDQTIAGSPPKRTGIGLTRLGTTAAIALGAYAYALGELAGLGGR
jgi:glucokinase